METSKETSNIYKKLFKIRKEVGPIIKSSENSHFGNKYADINKIIEDVLPKLEENNILTLQPVSAKENCNHLETHLIDTESGEWIKSGMDLILDRNNMQGLGSAITYARRYSIQSLLFLQAEDDDGNAASNNAPSIQTPAVQSKPQGKTIVNGEHVPQIGETVSINGEQWKYMGGRKRTGEEFMKWVSTTKNDPKNPSYKLSIPDWEGSFHELMDQWRAEQEVSTEVNPDDIPL